MYEVEVTWGNGYGCSCCRRTTTRTEEFETYEGAMAYVARLRFKRKNRKRFETLGDSVETDFTVERIYRVEDWHDGVDEELQAKHFEELEADLKKREAKYKKAQQAKKRAAAKKKEAAERKKLDELKAKYEGEEVAT
jgi:hypothetical protein